MGKILSYNRIVPNTNNYLSDISKMLDEQIKSLYVFIFLASASKLAGDKWGYMGGIFIPIHPQTLKDSQRQIEAWE